MTRLEQINHYLGTIDGLTITKNFIEENLVIVGSISIKVKSTELTFDVNIYPQYPFRTYDVETIKFFNKDLESYNHVMEGGLICIHTSHNPNIMEKLKIDIASLKNWIIRYYINKEVDTHYEHIIVPQLKHENSYYAFLFTNVDYNFQKGEFGYIEYSEMSNGLFKNENIQTAIVQNFQSNGKNEKNFCKWHTPLRNFTQTKNSIGLFVFIEDAPVQSNQRFSVVNWQDMKQYLSQAFLEFLHSVEKKHKGKQVYRIPLLVGYYTIDKEVNWQVIILKTGDFPIYGKKVDQKFSTDILDVDIQWGMSRNCSYNYFFGRGTFNKRITESKILIIGLGAIGSIVANTLVRAGSRYLDLIDYDQKEPENVCRSEYNFVTGINDKVVDLTNHLYSISPFVEIKTLAPEFTMYIKAFHKDKTAKESIEDLLNAYDIIFDCTTDNDLMYVLNKLNLMPQMINLSISNHAKDLVCGVTPNYYDFVNMQFDSIVNNDLNDLYNPTGCWSPTFKASYNDINVLVQYALKQINNCYENNIELRNFVITTDTTEYFKINLNIY